MIRIASVKVPLDAAKGDWPRIVAALLRVRPEAVTDCRLVKRSVDARRKGDIHLVLTLDVTLAGEETEILRASGYPQASIVPATQPSPLEAIVPLGVSPPRRPVVVGCGPAGLFAALTLARAGARPLLVERGRDARARLRDVQRLWGEGMLDPDSNVQFGEGGAGTFSDGKLNTGIKDALCGDVLRALVCCGAPEEILWQAKPHIGTDRLVEVVGRLREEIESLGGTMLFETTLGGLVVEGGALRGVILNDETIDAERCILAIGHSARDTLEMLHSTGLSMARKPFSIGARIEHPQAMVDAAQYGPQTGHPALGAAEYKLATHLKDGRGVYTFCMCPGGVVVAAASEAGGVVTNGMSDYARAGAHANSALLVDVRPEELPGDDPLEGVRLQRKWERVAFAAGGGGFRAPGQRVEDFLARRASRAFGDVRPTYRPGVTPADLRACLPPFVTDAMAEGIGVLGRQLRGFAMPDAVLTGVETRSSSPVRLLRDAQGVSSIAGLYPAGEGAGYAGGIMSAAVDGIRAALHALETLR